MSVNIITKLVLGGTALVFLAGCGDRVIMGKTRAERIADQENPMTIARAENNSRNTVWDLFGNKDDPNVTIEVNRYIWNATLEVLSFMPIEAADPFSGVVDFGYGTPPGGGRAYSGTVLVNDPALDARSLTVSLRTRGGPISAEAQRQVEDAILTRARQLRIQDSRL